MNPFDNNGNKEIKKDNTFLSDDPAIRGKLMQLGHSFTQAVLIENNKKLAEAIEQEAIEFKKSEKK